MKARMRDNSDLRWGRGCATTAICDGGADARQQRSAMGARMRDNSDMPGFGQIEPIPRPGL
jgi:hypothetical protein